MHSITSNHIDPSSFPLPHYEMYFINEGSSLRGNLKLLDWPYIRKCFPASTSTFKQQQQKMNQKQTGTEAQKEGFTLTAQNRITSEVAAHVWTWRCLTTWTLGQTEGKRKNILQTYELKKPMNTEEFGGAMNGAKRLSFKSLTLQHCTNTREL